MPPAGFSLTRGPRPHTTRPHQHQGRPGGNPESSVLRLVHDADRFEKAREVTVVNACRWLMCVLILVTVSSPVLGQTVQERVDILIDRYFAQRDAEKYDDALQTMLQARDLLPKDTVVWGCLAEAYTNTGKRVEAIAALRTALQMGSTDEWDRNTLLRLLQEEASAREEQGLLDDAERLLLEAHRLAPQDADVLCSLGVLFDCFRDDPADAIRYYEQALAVDAGCTWARGNLAGCLNRQGRYVEAEKLCRIGLGASDLDEGDRDWLRSRLIAALVAQGRYDEAEAVEEQIRAADPASMWAHSFADEMAPRAERLLGEGRADEAIEVLCRAAQRPYPASAVPNVMAEALRLRSPESDLEALEQQAAALVNADTAAATGCCLSTDRVARDASGGLWTASMQSGECQSRVIGDYLERGSSWRAAEYAHSAGPLCARAASEWLLFYVSPLANLPEDADPEGWTVVLGNDLGVSAGPHQAATDWVSGVYEADWCFPPADGQGRRLLDPQARRLTLTLSGAGGGQVCFEWELPLRQSRLAQAAWEGLTPERRQWLNFVSRQAVIDVDNRTQIHRLIADMALEAMPEEARGAARSQWSRHEVVRVWTLAGDQAAAASRLCLLGSHGEQARGRVASTEELEALFGPETWVECQEPVETPEGMLTEAIVVFPLTGPGGRSVLDDADGAVRIGLLGADGRTVAATYEFPRRVEDAPAD